MDWRLTTEISPPSQEQNEYKKLNETIEVLLYGSLFHVLIQENIILLIGEQKKRKILSMNMNVLDPSTSRTFYSGSPKNGSFECENGNSQTFNEIHILYCDSSCVIIICKRYMALHQNY